MSRKSRKTLYAASASEAPASFSTALYIRLSVEDNKKRGCSIENQQLVIKDYLYGKPEFIVYDVYLDNGTTGTSFHRPAFQRMLSDIEAGLVNCVIVKDLSRLGRNAIDTGYYIEQYFFSRHVRFIAVNDQFDSDKADDPNSGMMLPLKNIINEAYALDIGRKIKAQVRQAMKDGQYIGARAPYGYKKSPDDCHKLLVDEMTAPIVRQIFQWAYERVPLNAIVRMLNERGIVTPSHYKQSIGEITSEGLLGNGKWQTRTVAKLLSSVVYTGDLAQGQTKTVDHRQIRAEENQMIRVCGTHDAIISKEMFDAVQAYRQAVRAESRAKPQRAFTPNLLRGKVFCSHCGKSLHRQRVQRKKTDNAYLFHCITNGRVARNSCPGVLIREGELFSLIVDALEKELAVAAGKAPADWQLIQQEQLSFERDLAEKELAVEKTREAMRGLYEHFIQGILDSDEYRQLKRSYEESILKLTAEQESLATQRAWAIKEQRQHEALALDAKALSQSHVLTVDLIDRLIERIEVAHDKSIHIIFRFKSEWHQEKDKLNERSALI